MKSFARSLRYSRIASVAIVLLLQLDGYARAITIDDCSGDGTVAKLTHVDIENCGEKDEFCPFVKGRNATTEIAFHTNAPFKEATIDVAGKFGGISVHFNVEPADACGNYGFSCPVGSDEDKSLKITLAIKKSYPKGFRVTVVFKLLDENKKNIFCISFPAKIVDKLAAQQRS